MSKREDSSDSSNVQTPEFSKIEGSGSRDQSLTSFEFLEGVRTIKQMPLFEFEEGNIKNICIKSFYRNCWKQELLSST